MSTASLRKHDPGTPRAAPRARLIAVPRRRTQAERTEATRARIIDACIKLLRAHGYAGLRTAAVSALAGVSRGAMLHHFATKHDLVVATMRAINQRSLDKSLARAAAGEGDPIAALIVDFSEFYFGDLFFIELAITLGEGLDKRLGKEVRELLVQSRFRIEGAWRARLCKAGLDDPLAADVLALTQSLVRGFALRQFIEKNPERIADLVGVWCRILAGHLAGLGVGDLVDTKPGAIRALEASVAAAVGRARGQATANRGGRK